MSELRLHPADAEDRLGFTTLRARWLGHARTPYGAERLAERRPSADVETVRARLARAGEAAALVAAGAPLPIAEVPNVRRVLVRVAPRDARVDGEALDAVRRVLVVLRELRAALYRAREDAPTLWHEGKEIVVLSSLEERIESVVDETGAVRDDASPELRRLARELAAQGARQREALNAALKRAQSDGFATADGQPTLRGGRAVIPVRADAKRKVDGFVHDVSGSGQTVYIEPASVVGLGNALRELQADRAREVDRLLRGLSGQLRQHRRDLAIGLDVLGRIDASAAGGRLAAELDALVPEVGEGGPLRLVQARNPVLVLHLSEEGGRRGEEGDIEDEGRGTEDDVSATPPEPATGEVLPAPETPTPSPQSRERSEPPRSVVPLSLAMGEPGADDEAGGARVVVVTGPNAGGKSVAMKTVGLACLMAAYGLPVAAAPGTRVPVLRRLFVDLGDQQSIADDLSTFTSHLGNLGEMLGAADDRTLCLIDEAGTGTDPAEGGALAEAVLRRLGQAGALVVATTHHGSLKAFAHDTPGVANASMQFDRATLAPTYRFQAGVPGSSYAFEIAERVGLDAGLVGEARAAAGDDKVRLEELIAEFETHARDAERRAAEAELRLTEANTLRDDYEGRLARLRADADRRRAEALAAADQILADANATVERTVREIKEAQAETEATREARRALEDAKERVTRRQRNVEKRQKKRAPRRTAKPPAPVAAGPIEPGDQVRIDGGETVGEVLELTDREAVVALGALTSRVKRSRLTKVGGARPQRVEVRAPRGAGPQDLPVVSLERRLDLRGERVEAALSAVQRFVDEGLAAGLGQLEILHGKGTGALRQAIHQQLAGRRDVAGFEVAPYDQGGDGVTIVRL